MEVYNQTDDDDPEDSTGIIWMFLGAGVIGIVEQIIKYITKS